MARSGLIKKRENVVDPIYKDRLVSRFINRVMRSGKRPAAQQQVYRAMEIIKEKLNEDALLVFHQAIENVKPLMEVRSRRVGGAAYQVPAPVRGDRKESLAIRWLILAAQKRSNKEYRSFAEKMAAEMIEAFNKTGGAIKKREDVHRMAEANKAFAHFRW